MTVAAESRAAVRYVLANWLSLTLLIGALVILLPLHLEAIGFGVGQISAVVGAAGVGGVVSADPVGRLANHLGPVRLVRLGVISMGLFVFGIGVTSTFGVLIALHAGVGVSTAMVRVGSQMLVRSRIDEGRRGRVHALQGQTTRVGMLAVPLLVSVLWDQLDAAANFAIPTMLALLITVLAGTLVIAPPRGSRARRAVATPFGVMARYAAGPTLFSAARSGRLLLIPLVGLEIQLSPVVVDLPLLASHPTISAAAQLGLIVAASSAADVIVSPVSGPLMDRRGRRATIIPSFTVTALGFVLLALASDLWLLALAAVVLGIGNGFSAGLLLTLGTDLAPEGDEGPFLGRFGALHDIGRLIGPFLVGVLGELLGLSWAAVVLAIVTVVGLGLVLVFIGETRPQTSTA